MDSSKKPILDGEGYDLASDCPICGDPMKLAVQSDEEGNPSMLVTVEAWVCPRCADGNEKN